MKWMLALACAGSLICGSANADPFSWADFYSNCAAPETEKQVTRVGDLLAFPGAASGLPFDVTVERARCTLDPSKVFVRVGMSPITGDPWLVKPKMSVIQNGHDLGWFGVEQTGQFAWRMNGDFVWEPCNFDCTNIYGGGVWAIKPHNHVPFDQNDGFTLQALMTGSGEHQGKQATFTIPALNAPIFRGITSNAKGLWWTPEEPGWGLVLDRNLAGTVYANWHTFDEAGDPIWFVMPNGQPVTADTIEGDVYEPRGPAGFTLPYDVSRFSPGAPVGRFRIRFMDSNSAVFDFDVKGYRGTKAITPLVFRRPNGSVCANQRGVWWQPRESGWALALEGSIDRYEPTCPLHAIWSTYRADGRPTWYFSGLGSIGMRLNGVPISEPRYDGALYQLRGPFFGASYRFGMPLDRSAPLGDMWIELLGDSSPPLVFNVRRVPDYKRQAVERFEF